jgi:hypothetical protein
VSGGHGDQYCILGDLRGSIVVCAPKTLDLYLEFFIQQTETQFDSFV